MTRAADAEGASGAADASGVVDDLSLLTFEQLVDQLEEITQRMAAGDIGIEEVADLYEQAGRLHAAAAARLEAVRQRIEDLADHPG
jgi:exodeoxyribonuclease VII small subunit